MAENDKQEKIIEAAYQVLAEKGYDEASTKEIARVAGVAQGLINYYFSSKDLLFAELFLRESKKYLESSISDSRNVNGPLTADSIKLLLETPRSSVLKNPSWIKLRYELFAIGLRNPAVSGSIKETLARKRAHIAALIESASGLPEEHTRPLAAILIAVFDGLGLQKMCDQDFKYDEAYDTLAVLLESYLKAVQTK